MNQIKNLLTIALLLVGAVVFGQVTNSGFSGTVKDSKGEPLMGANVLIVHLPTGTKYGNMTDDKGSYNVLSVKPGGPYKIVFSYIGYKSNEINNVEAPLGKTVIIDVVLNDDSSILEEVVITGNKGNNLISKDRTGASQQFSRNEISQIPVTGSRTINDITKYNPNGNGSSFGGQDSRLNNFTIDGSVFNNGFGLGSSSLAGGRTGSSAISLDAIEQLQVNIAPFDVRQSGFTGAGLNAVTRSGTNEIKGSIFYSLRNESNLFLGTKAGNYDVTSNTFNEKIIGASVGAPIIKDKLFLFVNGESVGQITPASNYTATGSPNAGSLVALPTYTEMQNMSTFLQDKFGYNTGGWEGYDSPNKSLKFLGRLDWNINDRNKLIMRYVFHNSSTNFMMSSSTSLGIGGRSAPNALTFEAGGYQLFDNTRSFVTEFNSQLNSKFSNNLILGYDYQNEDRGYLGDVFPTVDIKKGTKNYITIGMDPFTPKNQLNYYTMHLTDNLTYSKGKHTAVLGLNLEYFKSNNMFYPGSHGVYVYNSLDDFYRAAYNSFSNGGQPAVTGSAVPAIDLGNGQIIAAGNVAAPAKFQLRYSALEGKADPLQVMKTYRVDPYIQDDIRVNSNFKLTLGLRAAIIWFDNTALENPAVTAMTFVDGKKFNTGNMPKTQVLLEPRLGFNLDVKGNSKTQLRGGLGVFTGRPPYVFLSNQIGNNGVLTGFIDPLSTQLSNYGFTPDPAKYFTPAVATLPTTFDLAFTDSNYKFPQVAKINAALDQKLPFGFVGTVEAMFNKNINEVYYYNANQEGPIGFFNGVDTRPRFARTDAGMRINDNVSMASTLSNSNKGYYESITLKLEYPAKKGLFGSFAYTRSESKDLMSAGSIASGSFTSAVSVNGNNDMKLTYSNTDTPHRMVGLLGYKINYGNKMGGATTITLGYIGQQSGRFSYAISGDMNGDKISGNDLMYIPENASDIKFKAYTLDAGTPTEQSFSVDDQVKAFNAYIEQDEYLSEHRGEYAERNGAIMPLLHRFDLSVTQDFNIKVSGKTNALQVRADILNFSNLINKDFGVSKLNNKYNSTYNSSPILEFDSVGSDGIPVYKLAYQTIDGVRSLVNTTFIQNKSVYDVWRAQLTLRYTFN